MPALKIFPPFCVDMAVAYLINSLQSFHKLAVTNSFFVATNKDKKMCHDFLHFFIVTSEMDLIVLEMFYHLTGLALAWNWLSFSI